MTGPGAPIPSAGSDSPPPAGYVQVYTGDGKGKTTAALGLALRAAGAGMRVFIAQFAKAATRSENIALERYADLITVRQYGQGRFIKAMPTPEDVQAARRGLGEAKTALASGEFRVVILDEANVATYFNLFSVDDLLGAMDAKPPQVELVITGRRADRRVIERADLVTDMREVKHYYAAGVRARIGIEK